MGPQESRLYTWTKREYAIGKARYTLLTGKEPARNLAGALEVLSWWEGRYHMAPGEVRLAGVEDEMDMDWAIWMWMTATMECAFGGMSKVP